MKNLHLIQTDKPSRLAILHNNKLHIGTSFKKDFNVSPQHIYITNDEKIKEGDWFIDLETNDIRQCTDIYKNGLPISKSTIYIDLTNVEKIILTTDQDLINDGVQSIDDEFLEWFEKNPSCEEVGVGYGRIRLTETDNEGYWVSIPDKQFEMQQEEPKQIKCYCGHTDYCDCGPLEEPKERLKKILGTKHPKQETLEEVAKKIYGSEELKDVEYYAFINGAKWQQQNSYSEKEAGELVYNIIGKYGKHYDIIFDGAKLNELFEEFKKK